MEENSIKTDPQSVDDALGLIDRTPGVEIVDKQKRLHLPLHQSEQQEARDGSITRLLSQYVKSYEDKISFSESIRKAIVYFSFVCVSAFIIASLISLLCYVFSKDSDWHGLAAVVSAFLTCAGLLIGVLKVITEYAFPINSEKNITEIVKAIQKSDSINRYFDLKYDSNSSGAITDLDDMKILDELNSEK